MEFMIWQIIWNLQSLLDGERTFFEVFILILVLLLGMIMIVAYVGGHHFF